MIVCVSVVFYLLSRYVHPNGHGSGGSGGSGDGFFSMTISCPRPTQPVVVGLPYLLCPNGCRAKGEERGTEKGETKETKEKLHFKAGPARLPRPRCSPLPLLRGSQRRHAADPGIPQEIRDRLCRPHIPQPPRWRAPWALHSHAFLTSSHSLLIWGARV